MNYWYTPYNTGYGQQQSYYAPPQQFAAPITLPAPGTHEAAQSVPPPPVQGQPSVAYTSVAPASGYQTQATTSEPDGQSGWPPALRKYVERAFALDATGDARTKLQQQLKEIIASAQQRGEVWTKDWDNTPLPDVRTTSGREASTSATTVLEQRRAVVPNAAIWTKTRERKRPSSPSPLKVSGKPQKPQKLAKTKEAKKVKRNVLPGNTDDISLQEQNWERAQRFGDGLAVGAVTSKRSRVRYIPSWDEAGSTVESENSHLYSQAVRGTCWEVEKSYYRLTSKPDPSTVRPEPVLQQALSRLVLLLRKKKVNYFYAADQFKGMRQDCTVQHLKNSLSASIYEAHARAALENGDLAEFNQCQSQLLQHYSTSIAGCREEFVAYRILYQAAHGRESHATLLTCLQSLSPEDARHPSVSHALQVREALAVGDLAKVCALYISTPNMGRALLDTVLPKIRFAALKVLVKAYLPSIPVPAVARRLGFSAGKDPHESSAALDGPASTLMLPGCTEATFPGRYSPQGKTKQGNRQCEAWLQEHGAHLIALPGAPKDKAVDCKSSAKDLHLPESDPAAAAGPDLAIDDFLKTVRFD